MSGPLRLNMHSAQKWAAVVSGTVWKTWGLSPSGTLEAKATRGPLIIWAKPTPGEEGEAVKLEAPKPSPLDLRVMALNTAAHFERFRKAARGKVRPSVRWKTGRKVRRARVGEALRGVRRAAHLEERRAAGLRGFTVTATMRPNTAKARREWEEERFLDRLRDIAPAHWEDINGGIFTCGWNESELQALEEARLEIRRGYARDIYEYVKSAEAASELVAYLTALEDIEALRLLFPHLDGRRHREAYLSALARLLQRAAYLAHVRRTVKPAPRRGRLPRPVYARPRPPSAPLAPPVA